MVYNKEDLLRHIQIIKPKGFELLKDSFGYTYIEKDCTKIIHLATRNYFPHGAYIHGVSSDIYFNEIEEILTPLYLSEGVKNTNNYTVKNSHVDVEAVRYDILDQEIKDEESFAKISGELHKLIEVALTFFSDLKTINDLAELLANKTPKEIVPWIQGSILFTKTILILKLSEHPNYKEKRDNFYPILKNQASKKRQAEPHLKVFERLFYK